MALVARVGVRIPSDAPDPVADVRRLESLGFAHAALIGLPWTQVVLALGGTCTLPLISNAPESAEYGFQIPAARSKRIGPFPPGYGQRLRRWSADESPLQLHRDDLSDAAAVRSTIEEALRVRGQDGLTVELVGGPHAQLVHTLALDVLIDGLPGRAGDRIFADDLRAGDEFELGTYTLSEEDIVSFAERWDPLDFHIDGLLAQASPIGVLCASGVHTMAVIQRLAARGLHRSVAMVAGRKMLGMRLWEPVLAGMTLVGRTEIVEVTPRPSGRAIVVARSTLTHQGRPILEVTGEMIVEQHRPPGDHLASPTT